MVNQLGQAIPENEEQAIQLVESWARERRPFGIQGSRSKFKVSENLILDTSRLSHVVDFDKGNLTITVQAGASIEQLRRFVEQSKQYLWVAGSGTVGGVISTRASSIPPLRDQILGMRVLLSNGDVVKFGAKTMKNVAGYDAAKLLIGSWGTLGVILDVTFRLFPTPPAQLESSAVQPFVMKDLHKKIKEVFDPYHILSMRTALLTAEDVKQMSQKRVEVQGPDAEKIGDGFWGAQ